jgi:hypothetical protein
VNCTNKWCSWIQALSQIAIAVVIVFAGITVNTHMESWTESFTRGSHDLHSIRNNMNNIAYSMESINNDMDDMRIQMSSMNDIGDKIEQDVKGLTTNLITISNQLNYMNYSVKGMGDNFSPQGMLGSMMPF